jgi:hypothetical protein
MPARSADVPTHPRKSRKTGVIPTPTSLFFEARWRGDHRAICVC